MSTTNVYEGIVISSRAYEWGNVAPWRVDYEIADSENQRYIFMQSSEHYRPAVPAGARVRFSWWSTAASAAGWVHGPGFEHACEVCGLQIARISEYPEYVDRLNNEAAEWPHFHEHKPAEVMA